MREMTFKAYTKYYLRDLTGSRSLNIHKLAKKLDKNRRLLEPLILYCLYFNKKEILKKYVGQKYLDIVNEIAIDNVFDEKYRYEYTFLKIRTSYQRKINVYNYDRDIKSHLRDNIKTLMKNKNVSTYYIYKSLDLNKGNVNAFISKGDIDKLSLEKTRKILHFVKEI